MSTRKQRSKGRANNLILTDATTGARTIAQDGWSEYIPVHELHVEPAYQRDVTWSFVAEIAANLDHGLLQTADVARRECPPYDCEVCGRRLQHRDYLMDGQHRVLGIRQRGDDLMLQCHVRLSQGSAWEADQYLRINFNRKAPTSAARYKAAVHAGAAYGWDNDEAVRDLLTTLGIPTLTSTSAGGTRAKTLPAELAGIGALCKLHERHPDLAAMVLTTLRDAWSEEHANAYSSTLLGGIADFYAAHEAECNPADVVRVLARTSPNEVLDAADGMRGNRKYPLRVCVARHVAETFNASRKGANRVREIAPVGYVLVLRARKQRQDWANLDPEAQAEKLRGLQERTPEERSEGSIKGWQTRNPEAREATLRRLQEATPEERSARALRGAATRRAAAQE